MWSPERAVLEANVSFYEAFANQDFSAMQRLWSSQTPVICIHPGWPVLHGREQVLASWRAILNEDAPPIRCEDARVVMLDQFALVTCTERILDNQLAATNGFVLEDGLWRLVHHQAGPFSPRPIPPTAIPPKSSLN